MRFAEKGYYIEQYVKCANCGMLIYGEGIQGSFDAKPAIFCTAWCREWPAERETWTAQASTPSD
jgi:N-methylhydantoinase B